VAAVVYTLEKQAVSCQDLLAGLVAGHKFGNKDSWKPRNNFKHMVEEEMTIECANGQQVIPAGSELVVYQHPEKVMAADERIATFHHPDKRHLTVIWGSGEGLTRKITNRGQLDMLYDRRMVPFITFAVE